MIMHFFKKIQNKISASYLLFLTLIILVGIARILFLDMKMAGIIQNNYR